MAGVDADGQGLGSAGAQHGKGEGGDNELFHDNDPWENDKGNRCWDNASGLTQVPALGNLYSAPPSRTLP
jgi:hypothetical protein